MVLTSVALPLILKLQLHYRDYFAYYRIVLCIFPHPVVITAVAAVSLW